MALTFDATVAVGLGLSALVATAGPLGLGLSLWRRFGASPRAFLWGALTFFVSQVVLRFPWQLPLNAWLAPRLKGSPGATLAWLAASALTAGVFEETGRWVAYRRLWRDRSTPGGVMLGVGHGGLEAVLLVGLSLVSSLVLYALLGHGVNPGLPADVLPQVEQQFADLTLGKALLGGAERVSALGLHVACSLLVLEGARSGRRAWLAGAIAVHAALNFVVVVATMKLGLFAAEALLAGLVALALGLSLRRSLRWAP